MLLEKRRMKEAGAKYFVKAIREGDYFYHMTSYANLKKIIGAGTIKADRHRRGTVSFTTNPFRYLSAFGGPFLAVNDSYIKIPMSLVPQAFPVVYYLSKFEAEELQPQFKPLLIPFEMFENLFYEYGLAWRLYVYPFIWATENEWRLAGDFPLPWREITVGVSKPYHKKVLDEWFSFVLKDRIFVDEDLRKFYEARVT